MPSFHDMTKAWANIKGESRFLRQCRRHDAEFNTYSEQLLLDNLSDSEIDDPTMSLLSRVANAARTSGVVDLRDADERRS